MPGAGDAVGGGVPDGWGVCLWLVLLSESYLLVGHLSTATSLAHEALVIAQDRQERGVQGYALRLLGALAAQGTEPDMAAAEGYYQQAIGLAQELGMRPLLAHCHLGVGLLYSHLGQRAPATAALSTAVELYRAAGHDVLAPAGGSRPGPMGVSGVMSLAGGNARVHRVPPRVWSVSSWHRSHPKMCGGSPRSELKNMKPSGPSRRQEPCHLIPPATSTPDVPRRGSLAAGAG